MSKGIKKILKELTEQLEEQMVALLWEINPVKWRTKNAQRH
jgi:hypothetical protein